MVDLARKNLLNDKLRFAITVSGVAFAVTLVLVQVGLFIGLLDNATVTIDNIPADLWVTTRNTPNIDFSRPFPAGHVHRVRSIPGVERADNLIVWFAQITLPTGVQEGMEVYALENFGRWGLPWSVLEGNPADLTRGDYLFLDESAQKRFGAFRTGEYREVNGTRFKIIGRSRGAQSFTTMPLAFMDLRRTQDLAAQLRDQTTYIVVQLAPGADRDAVRREILRRLPYNDVYTREEWAARSRNYWVANTGLGLNLAVTVFLGILVGIVIVAQTLYTSTMEHLKEFGTVKAIGGGNREIYGILARQAGIAAVVGFALGAGMAFLARPAIESIQLKLIIPGDLIAVVFAGTVLFCLAAALVSFRKVAAIDPAMVFRT